MVDPDDHHLFVSLGCLAETLDLAAWQSGVGGKLTVEDNDAPSLRYELGDGRLDTSRLFDAITVRQSTRSPFAGRKANPADLRDIVATAATGSTRIAIVDDASRMAQFADLIAQGNSRQLADPRFIAELKRWLRFNPHDAMAKGDGLFSAASGSPVLPSWLGPRLFDLSFDAATENRKYREQVASSAGLAVFFADQATPRGWIDAGRTCQRFALAATAQGMKVAFINQPVEVPELRARCAELAGWPGKRPDLVMRYGFGDPMPYSCRRPVSAVIA